MAYVLLFPLLFIYTYKIEIYLFIISFQMRENTLQLLIFSLVIFPSTEFKVNFAIDKVVAMVGDPRKRVRHSALDTLAVISQIYESEV
jgi:hypothetical protein